MGSKDTSMIDGSSCKILNLTTACILSEFYFLRAISSLMTSDLDVIVIELRSTNFKSEPVGM